MSESADFYMSWLGCNAFGVTSRGLLAAPEPIVFLPTDLSDCSVWFDANNSASLTLDTKDDSSVLSWQNLGDASGAMLPNLGTGLSGVDTINALNVIQFGASNNMYWYGQLTAQPKTTFFVFKALSSLPTIGVPFFNLWNGEASEGYQLGIAYSAGTYYYVQCESGQWCVPIETTTDPYETPQYISARIDTDTANNFMKINGVAGTITEQHAAAGFNTNPIPYTVNRIDGSSMDVAEIIIYNRALTDEEVTQVEAYLAAKWAIT